MKVDFNQIRLSSGSAFARQFNLCSELFEKWHSEEFTEDERVSYFKQWTTEWNRLEQGIYTGSERLRYRRSVED